MITDGMMGAALRAYYDAPDDKMRAALVAYEAHMAAAGWVRVPVELLTELADDLQAQIVSRGDGERRMRRDLVPVGRARTILANQVRAT